MKKKLIVAALLSAIGITGQASASYHAITLDKYVCGDTTLLIQMYRGDIIGQVISPFYKYDKEMYPNIKPNQGWNQVATYIALNNQQIWIVNDNTANDKVVKIANNTMKMYISGYKLISKASCTKL